MLASKAEPYQQADRQEEVLESCGVGGGWSTVIEKAVRNRAQPNLAEFEGVRETQPTLAPSE